MHPPQNSRSSPVGSNVATDAWLLFGLLGGAIAWLLHLVLAYLVAEFGCVSPFRDVRWLGFSGVAWLEVIVTLIALVIALLSSLVANRVGRQFRGEVEARRLEPHDPRVFLSRSGVLSSRVFIFIIAVESLPILYYLHEC